MAANSLFSHDSSYLSNTLNTIVNAQTEEIMKQTPAIGAIPTNIKPKPAIAVISNNFDAVCVCFALLLNCVVRGLLRWLLVCFDCGRFLARMSLVSCVGRHHRGVNLTKMLRLNEVAHNSIIVHTILHKWTIVVVL